MSAGSLLPARPSPVSSPFVRSGGWVEKPPQVGSPPPSSSAVNSARGSREAGRSDGGAGFEWQHFLRRTQRHTTARPNGACSRANAGTTCIACAGCRRSGDGCCPPSPATPHRGTTRCRSDPRAIRAGGVADPARRTRHATGARHRRHRRRSRIRAPLRRHRDHIAGRDRRSEDTRARSRKNRSHLTTDLFTQSFQFRVIMSATRSLTRWKHPKLPPAGSSSFAHHLG